MQIPAHIVQRPILYKTIVILLLPSLLRPPKTIAGGRGDGGGDLLQGPSELVVLSHPVLSPLLAHHVLDHALLGLGLQEFADKSRIPEFRCHTQVLAAAHQGVGFAALGSGGDTVGVEVGLFATSDRDESIASV